MKNVAFFGPMCSGKTYMANYLAERYEYEKLGFATKLKEVAADLFDIDVSNKNDKTRKLLQGFSDDVKKWGGEDIWVKIFLKNITPWPTVCDDLRYTFEADALREAGFLIIQVMSSEPIRQERIASLYPDTSDEAQQHKSEQDYKNIVPDYIVYSNKPKDVEALGDLINGGKRTRPTSSICW